MTVRVAMVDPSLFTYPYDGALCEGLERAGARVTLLGRAARSGESLTFPTEPFFHRTSERLRDAVPAVLERAVRAVEHATDMRRLLATARAHDVVHFQWSVVPWLERSTVRALSARMPTVLTVHDSVPFHGARGHHLQRLGGRSLLDAFRHLIVHTDEARGRLLSSGVAASRVSVLPHGVIRTRVRTDERPREVVTVLLFGSLKPYKGLDVLIEAFGLLPAATRDRARLRVVGVPSVSIAALRRRAAVLGVGERIDWDLRYVASEEIGDIIADADVVALPYRQGDASGVLMSVLPHGRAIVASDIGGFRAVLRDRVHGRLVPAGDPGSLAGALATLIDSPDERRSCGAAVRRLATEVPSWEEIGARTAAVYARLLKESRVPTDG